MGVGVLPEQQKRPISSIAADIFEVWPRIHEWCLPYANAMLTINLVTEDYFEDTAEGVLRYFLSNAKKTWRGDDAKRIKAELNAMLA